MTPEQRAAYVFAKAASMLTEMEGMKALNAERERQGHVAAYTEDDFLKLPEKFGLDENSLTSYCFNQS